MRRLEGRAALVTGGGSGIGRATALRLAAEGASAAVSGRRADLLAATVSAVTQAGGAALAVPGDVTVAEDARRMVEEARNAFGRLDMLVNNAGAIRRGLPLHEVPLERWDEQIAVNLRGVFLLTREALPVMLEADGDRSIVNIASTFAHTNAVGVGPYAAAKGAVVALTRSLAVEYARKGVRVNCVCPAIVDTPLARVDRTDFDEPGGPTLRCSHSGASASPRTWRARSRSSPRATPPGLPASSSTSTAASPLARRPSRRSAR